MIEQKKQWLMGVSWDSIVNVNRTLCQAQKLDPLTNPKTHSEAQRRWEQAGPKSMTLLEAFEVCRQTFDQSPFTFNNGNTFASIARSLVEEGLREAPAVEAQILRSTISHYVAGTIDRKELAQVLSQLSSFLSPLLARRAASISAPSPTPSPAPAPTPAPARPATSTGEVAAPRLTEARPVASS